MSKLFKPRARPPPIELYPKKQYKISLLRSRSSELNFQAFSRKPVKLIFGISVHANRSGDASSCDCIDKVRYWSKEVIQDESSSKEESCIRGRNRKHPSPRCSAMNRKLKPLHYIAVYRNIISNSKVPF